MEARVQKWGNSLALRIPKAFAGEIGLEENAPVQIERVGHQLIVTPVAAPVSPRLAALLEQITPETLHDEVETGPAQGQEAW
jgi:antitoxin MazE